MTDRFPDVSKKTRSARKRRTDSGFETKTEEDQSNGWAPNFITRFKTKTEEDEGNGWAPNFITSRYNEMKYHMLVTENLHLYEDPKEDIIPEILKKPNPNSLVSEEDTSKKCPISGHKRKAKPKDESSDSKPIVPRRVSTRGQARRGLNVSTNEPGKLDSKTFLHYFTHIWSSFPEEKVKSVTFFDPLWFNLYASEKIRSRVLNWIKNNATFSKKYVLVPIVLWGHWSLLIFCHLGESPNSKTNTPCMLLLDPLHSIGPERLEPLIRRLLLDIYKVEEREENEEQLKKIPLLIPQVPQQTKGEECGYYILYYINLFIESAPEKFSVSKGYPYFMKKDWFTVEGFESFYRRLESFPVVSSNDDDDDDDESTSIDSKDSFSILDVT